MSAEIGDERAVVEVRNLPAEAATRAVEVALQTIATVERQLSLDNPDGPIAHLNAASGTGPRAVADDVGELLRTALRFCVWSRGAVGPLGGVLYRTWESAERPPASNVLERGVRTAGCGNLMVEPQTRTASLAYESRLDLRHFATGWAVDSAVRGLHAAGATDVWVEFRSVIRAAGPGPAGHGWEAVLPILPGMSEPLDNVWLRDGSLAVVSTHRNRFRFGAASYPPFIDQRSGAPASGTVGVMVASQLAIDAQAIGSAMIVLGNREGQLRLGGVLPSPSVLWLLGDGTSEPLLATYRWSELH
jgi:thiamine biosynthesis lipoprotein ApbE